MKIEKLQMCRICLVEDVRMYMITNVEMQQLYEKLTDIPFVTEDSRPMLACVFCYTRLKQCCQLQRKCLEAEKLFTQMLNEDDEKKSRINQDEREFFNGFIITPTLHVNYVLDECQSESDNIKEELQDDQKEEHDSIELEEVHLDIKEELQDDCEEGNESIEPEKEQYDINEENESIEFEEEHHDIKEELQDDFEQDNESIEPEQELQSGTLIKYSLSRMHFFEIWCAISGTVPQKHQYVLGTLLATLELENVDIRNLDNKILNLCKSIDRYWKIVSRSKSKFLLKYSNWLNEIECVDLVRFNEKCIQESANNPGPSCGRGGPRIDLFKSPKRRRIN